jgi:hypothetical protein
MSITQEMTARIEVLLLELNAIYKLLRSKKFRAFGATNTEAQTIRFEVYQDRQYELLEEVERLKNALNGRVQVWPGIF